MSVQSAPQEAGAGRNIGGEVRDLVNTVVKLANYLRDTAAAELLTTQATSAGTDATIVVAGETKQGKSSLINALIGFDALSPVHEDIATAVPVRVSYGRELRATLNLSNGEQVEVDPSELPGWISMAVAELGQLRQVSSVDIRVPSPLLEPGITLVDTPGVGGLTAGHAEMTLRALETATAMLFVTDADTLLAQTEFDFLARASEHLAAVVFVVTKIDIKPESEWRAVLEESRRALARSAPRFAQAPIIGVSALRAARSRAAAATDRPLAADLWVASGLGTLQSLISRRIHPVAATLTVANTVALTRSTLDRLRATARRNLDAATADPAVTAAFEAEQKRVTDLRATQISWSGDLDRKILEATTSLRLKITNSADALRVSATELIRTSGSRDQKLVIAQIDADLDAQAEEISASLDEAARSICLQLLQELEIASPLELSVAASGTVNIREFERAATGAVNTLTAGMAAATGWGLVARLTAGQGGNATAIGGALTSAAGVVGISAGVVPILLPVLGAVGVGYLIHRVRGGSTIRTELRGWARAEIDRAAAERHADVQRVLASAKLDIIQVVRFGLMDREREISAALEVARTARARSEQDRLARERNDTKVLATADRLIATADELLISLVNAASLTAPNTAGIRGSVVSVTR